MPPLPSVPNQLKVTMGWEIGGDAKIETIHHFTYSGGAPSTATCVAIAAQIQSYAATDLEALLYTSGFLDTVTVLDIATSSGAEGTATSRWAGTRAGVEMPVNCCVLLNHQIARRYRGGKPKSFLPFGVQADLFTKNSWSSALVNAVSAAWATFITNVNTISISGTSVTAYSSISYYQGYNTPTTSPSGRVKQSSKLRTTPIVDSIVASTAQARVGSQRRRLRQ